MRYHNITKADMLNGEGLRVVLWVSGCNHECPGCQNALTWNPNEGLLFDESAVNEIYAELDQDWCDGITLSGGDPLYPGNRETIRNLVLNIKEKYPKKTVWCYTGYTYEVLIKQALKDNDLNDILNHIDVLLDGPFLMRLADMNKHYVGSSNQRIIDMVKTREQKEIVLYQDEEVEGFKEVQVCHV